MKILKLLTFIFSVVVIAFSLFFIKTNSSNAQTATENNAACLTIRGTFHAKNWVGGPVMVGCDGDAGANCPGQVKTVYPGQNYKLGKCSCPPYADGCLKVAQHLVLTTNSAGRGRVQVVKPRFPDSCTISNITNVCGVNGQQIRGNFTITCQGPTPSVATPTPTGSCPVPSQVTNVKITCPNCTSTNSTTVQNLNQFASPTPTGVAASPTPTGNVSPTETLIPTSSPSPTP